MNNKNKRTLELMLIVVTIGVAFLLHRMGIFKVVVLNLFFLPVVLSGFFLGRVHAGILTVFSVLAVILVVFLEPSGFSTPSTPILIALAITVWTGALGLTAMLVGTLCDQRAETVRELHEAYQGIVEVLSRYLQSGNAHEEARSKRVAEFSQLMAEDLGLSVREAEDVRVGALLYDMGHVEITTRLIQRAADTIESARSTGEGHTFLGTDLAFSLADVLQGAVPLLLEQNDPLASQPSEEEKPSNELQKAASLGMCIIRAARSFDLIMKPPTGPSVHDVDAAIARLRDDHVGEYGQDVLNALERVVARRHSNSEAAATVSVP